VKATKAKIIALLMGVVIVGTGAFYLVKFLAPHARKPSTSEALSAGRELFEKKQYDQAIPKLEECFQKAPEGDVKSQALLFMARCYSAAGKREQAAQSWGTIVEDPMMKDHHPEAFYSLAALRSPSGTLEDQQIAQEYYKKAVAAAPDSRFADLARIEIANFTLEKGDIPGAQRILQEFRGKKKDYPELKRAEFRLQMKLLFSPTITKVPESQYYVVEEGDTLQEIAKKFGTTPDLLQESNRVDPFRLQIGKRLKVVTGKFQLKVSKSKNILQLISGDVVLNEYRIGTGEYGKTPAGRFKIADKVKEPVWFRDGRAIPYGHPDNVLGTRWLKLDSAEGQKDLVGYGIHGTDDQSTIGRESSQGCIRLLNRDVEELYKIVPIGTEVIIEQ